MKKTILIPCLNESKYIEQLITKVQKEIDINLDKIVIIDDGSTDGTVEILKKIEKNFGNILVVLNDRNLGKGASIKKGLKFIDDDTYLVIIQDADLEYNPENYDSLLVPFKKYSADVVFGSRYRGNNIRKLSFFWPTIANNFLTFLTNLLNNSNLTDMETGYKIFKFNILKTIDLKEESFGFEPEITIKCLKKKLKIFEVGIDYIPRNYQEGKKIKTLDGIRAIFYILKYSIK